MSRVQSMRSYHRLPAYDGTATSATLTLAQAAHRLKVSESVVRRLISTNVLPATHAAKWAPWEIAIENLNLPAVVEAVRRVQKGRRRPRAGSTTDQLSIFSKA